MRVQTLERESVCDCGRVRLHGMAECECLCARVQGVGGWVVSFFFFLESMTRHFLHPASAPDYGQHAQPRLAATHKMHTG